MEWAKVASGSEGRELFTKDGEYLVNVEGKELMSSYCHVSEDALATSLSSLYESIQASNLNRRFGPWFHACGFYKRIW